MGSGGHSTSTSSAGAAGNGAVMIMMMAGVTLKAISIVPGAGGITGGGSNGFIRGLNYMVADEAICIVHGICHPRGFSNTVRTHIC